MIVCVCVFSQFQNGSTSPQHRGKTEGNNYNGYCMSWIHVLLQFIYIMRNVLAVKQSNNDDDNNRNNNSECENYTFVTSYVPAAWIF